MTSNDTEDELRGRRALDEEDMLLISELREQNRLGISERMSAPSRSFTAAEVKDVTLSDDPKIQETRLASLAEMLGFSRDALEDEERDELCEAMAVVRGLAPQDEMERIAAYHVVSLNKSMGRAMHHANNKSTNGTKREHSIKTALKLQAAVMKGTDGIDRHRNKGKQEIKIVNVNSGGQAVVGDVDARKVENTYEAPLAVEKQVKRPAVRARKAPKSRED